MTEKRGRPLARWFIIVLILLLDVVLAVLLLNRWQLQLRLLGEPDITVEYGEDYRDPGVEASFGGERFLPSLFSPGVRTLGSVNTREIGDYVIRYSANILWFSESCSRTVRVRDTTPPVITLRRDPDSYTLPGEAYEEEGYSALDNADGDLTALVERQEEGGVVRYRVADSSGNVATAEWQIPYDDPVPPVLTLQGGDRVRVTFGTDYEEPGYTAVDNLDGDITAQVVVTGEVDPDTPGDYELHYAVEDRMHNRSEAVRIVTVGPKPTGVVYLTFDDGPGKYTQDLLDILDKYDVKVTFFVVNYGYAGMIGKAYADGHSIGVHSATHEYSVIYASEEAYFADLEAMNEIIFEQTGVYSELVRFPGGSSNTISDFNPGIMTRLTQAVVERGYQYFDWNVSSGDAGETTDPDQVYQNVIDGIRQHEVSIVLMHDSRKYTVDALERILIWCLDNGYDLRPLTKDSPASHHRINN